MSQEMECSECGADLAPHQKFCAVCGIELEWPTALREDKLAPEEIASIASGAFKMSNSNSYKSASRFISKQEIVGVIGGVLALLIILTLAKGSITNNGPQDSGNNSTSTSTQDSSIISGQPSTSDLVSAFSSGLDLNINQEDVIRGITFPSISKSVDVWSAPYFSLLIYPSADEQTADSTNFQSDYSSLNSSRSWESCQNFVVVFSPEMQSKVDSVVAKWCTSSSPSPASEAPSNSWYPSGYSEVSKGVAFKSLPLGSYLCDAGTICLEAYVEVKGGCSDSLYAEVNFLDSAGTIVDYGNHMSGVVPPKTPVLMTFSTTNPNAQTYKITTTNCYQR